ncbi:TrmH family RNA methyltransferase [Wukongibacter sp. M2B1]|uniref:TrmH family RNA methyltransferase n=1 Tax=Wukongibacter sp. M2B1 TaxID=3088895 RepID=UPI003D79AFF2
MTLEITSLSNKHIKHIKMLHKRKFREKNNEFIIEGLRIVEHGINSNANICAVYYSEEIIKTNRGIELLDNISSNNIDLYKVNDKILKEISTTDNSQGIIGIVKSQSYDLNKIINKDKFVLIILDRLQDPGNVGTIIRTADSAGVDGIIALKGTVDIYNSKTIRSTMGSIFTLPVIYVDEITDIINNLRSEDTDIIATTLQAEKYHFETKYKKRCAVIIGNEANGISEDLIELSNIKIKIPIIGKAESLNASIASGIIMYEMVRQNYFSEN